MEHLEAFLHPPPRPKSTPAEPDSVRFAISVADDNEDNFQQEDDDTDSSTSGETNDMQVDRKPIKLEPSPRPTKPLPTSKTKRQAVNLPMKADPSTNQNPLISSKTSSKLLVESKDVKPFYPHTIIANPSMLPVQARPPPANSQQRRLIVVLEQACLEAYRVSSGSGSGGAGKNRRGGPGGGGEAKYALLNCDDHQGILAKTGRDIADARPDITHQVSIASHMLPTNGA